MEKDKVFFAESGLSSTSANHVANLAKEMIQTMETPLENMVFYKTEVALIGSGNKDIISYGINKDFLNEIPERLDFIAKAKSLIAWLREAIKAKQRLLDDAECLTLEQFCHIKNLQLPISPIRGTVLTEDEYYASLDIKERNRYYQLETEAAVIGKLIHPRGTFSTQRADLKNKIDNPHSVNGNGRDAIIYSYTPTVERYDVDNMFFELQAKHREIQAQLNSMKYKCEEAINQSKIKVSSDYNAAYSIYKTELDKIVAQKQQYIEELTNSLSKLKIVIPNNLMPTYEKVMSLNK